VVHGATVAIVMVLVMMDVMTLVDQQIAAVLLIVHHLLLVRPQDLHKIRKFKKK